MNNASSSSIAWSNVDYKLQEFIKKFPLPQVVKVKKNGTKCSSLRAGTEIVLHESRTVKKVEACVVLAKRQFVIPYDCPAKLYQLSKAQEYSTLAELRKAIPTCRYFLVTSKPNEQELDAIQQGMVFTIVFKKNVSGGEVFVCQRKKSDEIQIPASAVGGYAPMATTKESKISDFVRHYSTFPVGIGLSESTLSNKSFSSLNELVASSQSGLIRLMRLYDENVVIASSTGRKKSMFSISKDVEVTVTASKALLIESGEHAELCKQFHSAVDSSLTDRHLSLAVSTDKECDILQWSYGEESTYEDVTPVQKRAGSAEVKRNEKATTKQTTAETTKDTAEGKEKTKGKSNEKIKSKDKEKSNEKEKEKEKENEREKGKSKEKPKEEKSNEKEKLKGKSKEKPKEKEKTKEEKSNEKEKLKGKSKEKPKEKENTKEKTKEEKSNEKEKSKDKEKSNEKLKEKEKVKDKKPKVEKQKSSEEKREVEKVTTELIEDDSGYLIPAELLRAENDVKVLEGDYEIAESSEKSPKGKATTFGRFMEKVKGKDKKKDRPSSEVFPVHAEDGKAKSSTLSAANTNKKQILLKNKAKTLSASDIRSQDDIDGDGASTSSPCEKEQAKKRDKGLFNTAGKRAGAKLRNKLGFSKVIDDQGSDFSKPSSPKESSLPPSPNDDDIVEDDMYVVPMDGKISPTSSATLQDRPLPQRPPEVSNITIPYDEEDIYDEINPAMDTKKFKIPKDLSKLTVDGVSDVLRYLNMHEHVPKFRRDQIDGEFLMSLNDDKLLGALGIADAIQRHKLKKMIKGWRPKN